MSSTLNIIKPFAQTFCVFCHQFHYANPSHAKSSLKSSTLIANTTLAMKALFSLSCAPQKASSQDTLSVCKNDLFHEVFFAQGNTRDCVHTKKTVYDS